LSWSYVTGDFVTDSCSISADGTVYVGGWDNSFYAFSPDGSLSWSYVAADLFSSSPALGPDGLVFIGSQDNNIYCFQGPTATPTATPTPNYLELEVEEAPGGGYNFSKGDQLTLNWKVYPDHYGFAGSPESVYLGVILSPEGGIEDRGVDLSQVTGTSGTLMLFYPQVNGPTRYPPARPGWKGISFPLASGKEGSLSFTVPGGVGQRCVFVGALVPFPVVDQCEVSNGFELL
jgi:hypothetical protein